MWAPVGLRPPSAPTAQRRLQPSHCNWSNRWGAVTTTASFSSSPAKLTSAMRWPLSQRCHASKTVSPPPKTGLSVEDGLRMGNRVICTKVQCEYQVHFHAAA
jgi:hypothetical protein